MCPDVFVDIGRTVGKTPDMTGRVVVSPHFLRSPEEPDGWSEVSRMGEESPKGSR